MLMICALIILLVLLLLSIGHHYYYRRQVYDLAKQLKNISKISTNQLLTQEIFSSEMQELVQMINLALIKERDLYKELQIEQRSKQELMINLSHDVRTPLTSLMGYLQLMEASDNEEDRKRYFGIIYQRMDYLKKLLDHLFLIERLNDSEFHYDTEPLNLKEIITQHVLSYYDQLKTAKIDVELNLKNDPVIILSNLDLINHVLDNLVKNVLDHGKDYLKITLTSHYIDQELNQINLNTLLVQTKNETMHRKANLIKVTYCNRIFKTIDENPNVLLNRFYQSQNNRQSSKYNTGLGLSIIKTVVEKLEGRIYLETADLDLMIHLYLPFESN
ncbi:sensor histidine kinase KdpD [Facklamia sp. 7083-14-GEN3]|uniref:sensor histidine kinase n=1 Tax=Facklamia sp. 7083-14-GEN3 TaxID=2973478 RepID=UPI00215BBE81|nr:HAMP domain-containing sensor histidine kinase [Facklamia sp. 7083-14-GEN3]MCR8969411.1 HAMP domain-containing histidine kinase [Facklamia sp. 7083-14-GEN3]